ncbi:MAG: FAD-dependent oxidoreductase [Pseudomonadota bacterium]
MKAIHIVRVFVCMLIVFAGFNGNAEHTEMTADIVVVGAGAAGLSAAVSAAFAGAQVVVLEKMPFAGGSSNYAEGLFGAETNQQRLKAIDLSKDEAFKRAMEFNHWRANAALVRQTIDKSAETLEWLGTMGIEFDPVNISPTEAPSWHLVKDWGGAHHGAALVAALSAKAKELSVKILYQTPGKELILTGNTVVGIKATGAKGEEIKIDAKAVVLATGGFSNSKEMINKWTRFDADKVFPTVPIKKTGDGINMALAAGADSEGWGLMLHPGTHGEGIKPLGPLYAITWQPLLWVNKYGDRFANESIVTSFALAGNAIDRQRDSFAWAIWDEETTRYVIEKGIDNGLGVLVPIGTKLKGLPDEINAAVAKKSTSVAVGASIEELARKIGIAPEKLKGTVDTYNTFKETNHDAQFGKDPKDIRPVKKANFYAVKLFPYFFVSLGGAKTSLNMEVLDKTDRPIPGLYAAGSDVGGQYGDTYTLWTSGFSFQFAASSGRIAGEHAAKYANP